MHPPTPANTMLTLLPCFVFLHLILLIFHFIPVSWVAWPSSPECKLHENRRSCICWLLVLPQQLEHFLAYSSNKYLSDAWVKMTVSRLYRWSALKKHLPGNKLIYTLHSNWEPQLGKWSGNRFAMSDGSLMFPCWTETVFIKLYGAGCFKMVFHSSMESTGLPSMSVLNFIFKYFENKTYIQI